MVRLNSLPPAIGEDIADEISQPSTNPYSYEPPLETDCHQNQIDLLIRRLKYRWQDRPDFSMVPGISH